MRPVVSSLLPRKKKAKFFQIFGVSFLKWRLLSELEKSFPFVSLECEMGIRGKCGSQECLWVRPRNFALEPAIP